jgi:hypothetical protein
VPAYRELLAADAGSDADLAAAVQADADAEAERELAAMQGEEVAR